ncbi:MAG: OmpA family protein [Thermodesulfobacteriota bacterium]
MAATVADCPQVAEAARQEMSLIAKRDLLAEAIGRCGNDAELNYLYGASLERLRKYEDALKYYGAAVRLNPRHAKAFQGMGDVSTILGDIPGAVAAYEKGLKLDPNDGRAKHSLETARIKLKSQSGGMISSEEFVKVMKKSDQPKEADAPPVEGPVLRVVVLSAKNDPAKLTDETGDYLSLVIGRALQSPALKEAVFEVGGYSDDSGSEEVSVEMSRKRAEAVRKYLVENASIDPKRLVVAAYGKVRPVAPNTTAENRMLNRRVEFKRVR